MIASETLQNSPKTWFFSVQGQLVIGTLRGVGGGGVGGLNAHNKGSIVPYPPPPYSPSGPV